MLRDLLVRYRQTLLLAVALLLPVASMYFHGKTRTETSVVERNLLAVTAPLTRVAHATVDGARGLANDYVLLVDVSQRNEELQRENRILLGEALKSRALTEELQRVKQLCGFRATRQGLATVPARVIGRDVSQFFQVVRVRIDTAGAAGLVEGQAVITHDGVVGRIEKLADVWADVMLVSDARSQVHATIPGKGVVGSVRGKGRRNEFAVQFVYLESTDRHEPIRAGDAVLTTGHDHVFPAGLEIGHIGDGAAVHNGPWHEFVLAPAVSYATLEEVLVVTQDRGPDTAPLPSDMPRPRRAVDPANTPDAPP
ncbi:MAG: rod shape-determining protein MreC [Myxococcales bacterium]|nr:rod shape-determining protein MreC [Myxococcales bacterium]